MSGDTAPASESPPAALPRAKRREPTGYRAAAQKTSPAAPPGSRVLNLDKRDSARCGFPERSPSPRAYPCEPQSPTTPHSANGPHRRHTATKNVPEEAPHGKPRGEKPDWQGQPPAASRRHAADSAGRKGRSR